MEVICRFTDLAVYLPRKYRNQEEVGKGRFVSLLRPRTSRCVFNFALGLVIAKAVLVQKSCSHFSFTL